MRAMLQLTVFFVSMVNQVASTQNDCGTTSFSESKSIITSPRFPLPEPHNLSCTYSIDVGRNNSVLLKFLSFDLESPLYADTCIHDWLTITCNETDDENLDFRKRSCGMDLPKTSLWFSNCPVVQLNFFADSSVTGGGFSIEYNVIETANLADNISKIDCGDSMFTSSSGFVRLPSNPTEYSANVDCNYTISTNNASTFSIGIVSLQLPQLLDSIADCDREYIMIGCISDGETEPNPNTSKTYCRRSFDNIPVQSSRIVFSNCSMVKISIRSYDYNYQGDNSIPFTVSAYDEDCGRTVFSGTTGIVTSPRFPLSHPHSLDCVYSIDVDRTKITTFYSLSFDLKGIRSYYMGEHCVHSWITVSCLLENGSASANPTQNRKFCEERNHPLTLKYSNCDSLTLNFVTNSSDKTLGFQFRYEMTSPGNATPSTSEIDRVNTSVTGRSGFITSPHYPLSYPHNVDYTYSFNINRTQTVGLYFYSFNLEGTARSYEDSCHYDWLMITSLHVDLQGVPICFRDKYCGQKTTPLSLSYSDRDALTLNFISDSSVTSGGFKIWYTIKSEGELDFGDTSFAGSNGVIISPYFPLPFPDKLNCKYSIDIGQNNSVQLKFKHFQLKSPESTSNCAYQWLTVTCNETTKANPNYGKKYCGTIQWTSSLRFVDCPSLVIDFFSHVYHIERDLNIGFIIEYTVTENLDSADDNSELDCGATTLITDTSGNISLPRNPTGYLARVNCTYTISTNRTDVIWLRPNYDWMKFLQSFQDCHKEYLMIGCVSEEEIELNINTSRVFCRVGRIPWHPSDDQLVFADCRILKLSIRSTNYDSPETPRISFYVLGPSEVCGNTSLSAPSGVISTQNFPFLYPKPVNCLYTIDSDQINSVVISVERLSFKDQYYGGRNCIIGRSLTITCLVNGTSVAERKLCGIRYYSKPERFPACQKVLLDFTSDYITYGHGLTLRYRMGDYELDCGTTVFTNSSGIISLPINPTSHPATVNCTYSVSGKDLRYIWINALQSSSSQLLRSFQDCDTEWVMVGCVSEEGSELNPRTKKLYCHFEGSRYDHIQFLFPDCRMMKLSIRSRAYYNREEFIIQYLVAEPDELCGDTSFSAPTGIVSAPKLPFRYPKQVSCVYTIDSGLVNSFTIIINWNSGCLTTTCLINGTSIDNPLAGRQLCGHSSTAPTTGRFPACERVLFNFSSEYVSTDSSFIIRYRIGDYELDCGATVFTNSSGIIVLPSNPKDYPATVNCSYTISTNRTSDIWIDNPERSSKYLKAFRDCSREGLTIGCISEGETELNPNTTRVFCSSTSVSWSPAKQLVFIDCRKLRLSVRSDAFNIRWVFPLQFSVNATNEICGNTSFSDQTGIISPPGLPSRYPKQINCVYAIESDHVNSVVLNIDRLTLGSCDGNWLTITCLVNGTAMVHPLANRKLCGRQEGIVARFPACRSVLLNLSTDYATEYTGFKIRYNIGDYDPECGNTSFTGPHGVITSPLFPLRYPHNLNCLYSITGGQRSAISLSFLSFSIDGTTKVHNKHYRTGCVWDWVTVSCLSDEAVLINKSTSIKYCGMNTTPLRFAFPSCAVVVLHFITDHYISDGGFKVRYTVGDADYVCGSPAYDRPSGVINVPWNYANYDGDLNCTYVINATEPSSISLTIWSISLQSLVGVNCQRDWLLIRCVGGRLSMNLNVTHTSCDYLNSSTQLTFPGCTATRIAYHRNVETTGRTFRVEYTVTGYGDNVLTTGLKTTSMPATYPAGISKSCPTGCELSSDSAKCDCLPVTRGAKCEVGCKLSADGTTCDCSTFQSDIIEIASVLVSAEIPITRTANCEVGCDINTDGLTCDCSTTHSGDLVGNIQMIVSAEHGHSVGISLAVILVVTGAICLGAFLLFRRRRQKRHSVAGMQANEEERAPMELGTDSARAESLLGAHKNEDRDTDTRYVPLRPISLGDHEQPSTSSNTA